MQTEKGGVHLAAEQITTTYVRAHYGAQFAGRNLFVPVVSSQLPEGLVIQEGLVTASEVSTYSSLNC